ncbi:MAG TPA: hypothetical protein VLX58_08450 [Bryobacteraceae bacterium]|nr:hypothetical protein [Bryobacteraceae bacterium]
MKEWGFAQVHPTDHLAQLHFFSIMKPCAGGEVEFRITVWEYAKPRDAALHFFAQADKQTNQKAAPFTPSGWGRSILDALTECIKAIHRFPYEGPECV